MFCLRHCVSNHYVVNTRFVKIRHYGLLSNRGRHERTAKARELLPASAAVATPAAEPSAETVTLTAESPVAGSASTTITLR